MTDETDRTIDNVGSLEEVNATPQQHPGEDGSLEAILATTSRDLMDAFAASINQSALREAEKTEEFKQELKRRLLRTIVDTYIWSTARFAREAETAEARLVGDMQDLLNAERDQGRLSPTPTMIDRLRARLCDLMGAVSRALAMFG